MKISFEQAVLWLDQSRLVAIPTETVYGLAARIDRPSAIEAIFRTKKRPKGNPLIVHVAHLNQVEELADTSYPSTNELMKAFWPGPLTLILPLKTKLDPAITSGLSTVAIRMPAHPLCLKLLDKTGPLVAPSANLSGRPSPSKAEHVLQDYDHHVDVLDGGPCQKGVESTILAWDERDLAWKIARLGALSEHQLERVLGYLPRMHVSLEKGSEKKPICPGQRWRHYAPKAHLRVIESGSEAFENRVVLGFSDRMYRGARRIYSLGNHQDMEDCLQRLYATLRQLDLDGQEEVWVDMNFESSGHGKTLHERLTKASLGFHNRGFEDQRSEAPRFEDKRSRAP